MENVPTNDEGRTDFIDLDVQYEVEIESDPAGQVNPAAGHVGEARPPRPPAPTSQAPRASRLVPEIRVGGSNQSAQGYSIPPAWLARPYVHPAFRTHRVGTTGGQASAHSSGALPYRSSLERRAARESRRPNLLEDGMASIFPSIPGGRTSGRNRVQNLTEDGMPAFVLPSIPEVRALRAYLPQYIPDDGAASFFYPSQIEGTASRFRIQNLPGHGIPTFDNLLYPEDNNRTQNLPRHGIPSSQNLSFPEGTTLGRNHTQNLPGHGLPSFDNPPCTEGIPLNRFRSGYGMPSFDNPSYPEVIASDRGRNQNFPGLGMPSFDNPSFPECTTGRYRIQNFSEDRLPGYDNPLQHMLQSIPEGRSRPLNFAEDGMNLPLLLRVDWEPWIGPIGQTVSFPNTATRMASSNQPNSEIQREASQDNPHRQTTSESQGAITMEQTNTTQEATLTQSAEGASGAQNTSTNVLDLSAPGNINEEQASTANQFDCFARSVAAQLIAMPFESAMRAQSRIQKILSDESIQSYKRCENPTKSTDTNV